MVALPSDVARSGPRAKWAFETVFKAMVTALGSGLEGNPHSPETSGMTIAALCVGGMVIARSLDDRARR